MYQMQKIGKQRCCECSYEKKQCTKATSKGGKEKLVRHFCKYWVSSCFKTRRNCRGYEKSAGIPSKIERFQSQQFRQMIIFKQPNFNFLIITNKLHPKFIEKIYIPLKLMMIRKVHTRGGHRQHFYHQTEANGPQIVANDIIRPPTSHPYSGYKSKKSQSQLRTKYSPNFILQSKLQANLKEVKTTFQSYPLIQKLPQHFKLSLNQMRVLIKNNLNAKCNEFDELLQSLAKSIGDVLNEKNQLLKMREINEKSIENISLRLNEYEKKTSKYDCYNQSKKINKKYESSSKADPEILLENCRLGELNVRYLTRINQLENRKIEKCTDTPSYKQNQTKIDTQLLRCHNRISYLEMKLLTAEKVQHQLLLTNERLQEQLCKLKTKLQTFEKDYHQNAQKMNQWRERALMQKEDGEIHIARQQFLLYSLKKLRENNKNLLNKFLTAYKSDQKIQKKDFLQSPNFEYEMDFFKSIKTMYEKGKGQRLYAQGEVRKNELGLDIQEVSLQIDYQNYKKSDSFDVSNLRYYRPTFYSFIEQAANPQLAQSRNKCNSSVSRVFIQVLRSIMASKLNQFMFNEHPQKYTRFPEFVYAWFEKFYFNTEKNIICSLQPFMQKPINQQLFYRDLMNIKLDQSWQIITFREFILEQLSLQQLYFYLMCQMLLYSKAGITKQIQCQGDFCILVEYAAAKSVLDITLNDFQSWNITFLTAKLRQKILMKKNKEYIEAGFFLRCLLEYYRIQRSNRYRYISKLCSEFQDKKGLRFSSFISVINKFTQVPTQTKLKLYRDCYCLTRGAITPQSIFIVCSQQMIFLKHLKMKSFYRLPKIISKPSRINTSAVSQNLSQQPHPPKTMKQMICLQPPDPYLYDIITGFMNVFNSDNNIGKRIEAFGVGEFNHQIQALTRALDDRNSEIGNNVMKCKHFLHYFSNAIEIVRRVTYYNFYQLLEEEAKKKSNIFWIQISDQQLGEIFAEEMKATFNTYSKINKMRVWKDKVYNFRINNAAKKIQKQVKKKFIEPYLQIYNYFCNEVKQAKEDEIKQGRK